MIKAIITAAGKGTRLLPMTKEMPKEMMPVYSKIKSKRIVLPLLQLIFEQLYTCKIRDYCFVVGREKRAIEDHFTPDHTYLRELSSVNRDIINTFYKKLENSHLLWVNQNSPKGFGDAVRQTERYIGKNNFVVHAGDVSILSKLQHPIVKMKEIGNEPSVSAVLLFRKVSDPTRHGVPTLGKISNTTFLVKQVIEKPKKPKSNYGLMPLYYFTPKIFEKLRQIKPGINGEYQLTDAIQALIQDGEKVLAIPLNRTDKVLDVGTVDSYIQAQKSSYSYV